MRGSRSASRAICGIVAAALLGAPVVEGALAASSSETHPGAHAARVPQPDPTADPVGPPTPPATPTAGGPPVAGATDTFALRSPLCDVGRRLELTANQRRACERTGSPLSGAPTSHYAFDINWDPAITQPAEVAVKSLYSLLNMLWLGLLFCLRGVLTLLDWAFSLNPFETASPGGGSPLAGLQGALERFFSVIDAAFLSAIIIAVGLWGMWTGLVRRRTAQTVGGVALSVAMLATALLVIHAPDRTVGLLARLANQAAMGLMAAPSHGLNAAPSRTYADAMRGVFDDVVRAPWCALDFRTQDFCSGPVERGAVNKALEAQADAGSHRTASPPAGGRLSRSELWLSFAPDSAGRKALHSYYGGEDAGKVGVLGVNVLNTPFGDEKGHNEDEVAIQGPAGGLTRLPLLVLIAIGVLGALLLLGWIMLRLLAQATLGFVLLLLAPVALLFVAFGDSGRAAFARWGMGLIGALVSKVIYAALLGVAILAARLLATGVESANWLLSWLLQSAFWWGIFLKRDELMGMLSVVPAFDGGHPTRSLKTLVSAQRLAGGITESVGERRDALRGATMRAREARSGAVREGAREHLLTRDEQRGSQHRRDATAVLERDHALHSALNGLEAAGGTSGTQESVAVGLPAAGRSDQPRAERAEQAERLSAERAALAPSVQEARAALAAPQGRGDERRARAVPVGQLQSELALPAHDSRHAWRVGLSPDAFTSLSHEDPSAHTAHVRTIRDQLAADRQVLRALPSDPRTPPQPTVERTAAGALDPERLEELRRARAERLRHDRDTRRYLYR